jgi:hypothetical protein
MKYIVIPITLWLLISGALNAQKPEKVYSIVKEDKPHSFYVKQAELWWKEIEKNDKNEKAWYYYYKANRYARMTFWQCETEECKKCRQWTDESKYLKTADEITDLISAAIPGTYTYYSIIKEGNPDKQERFNALMKAYELEPDNPDTYDELVVYYETNNLPEKRKEFNLKWFRSNDVSSGILNYNYNVLMSMQQGGVILTFGDNDTFPIWMLQDVLGIRKDITVLNISLLTIPDYKEVLFKKLNIPMLSKEYPDGSTQENNDEILRFIIENKPAGLPLYISTPAWKNLEEYENNLYLVGLVMQYSKENMDNMALLKNNFENKYALDYITNNFSFDISRGVVQKMSVNYLPGIIKLYQHYSLSGDKEKAGKIKQLGLLIADKAGDDWKKKASEMLK